jgi:hypothetical protein
MAEEGKSYLSILYNLGLIAFTASTIGLLMGKITDLIRHGSQSTDTIDKPEKAESER